MKKSVVPLNRSKENGQKCPGMAQTTKVFGGSLRTKKPLGVLEPNVKRTGRDSRKVPTHISARNDDDFLRVYEQVEDIDKIADGKVYDRHYAKHIIQYMKLLEQRRTLPNDYLSGVTVTMPPHTRTILIDWLVQVQHHLRLKQETLYLTIQLSDRFLATQYSLDVSQLQLVFITTLLISSKIEERNCPEIKTLVRLTDNSYNKEQVLKMEILILKELKFNLVMPDPMVFFNRCLQAMKNQSQQFEDVALYAMDIVLPSSVSAKLSASLLAASAVCLTRKILLEGADRHWNKLLEVYSGYQEEELKPTMVLLLNELKEVDNSSQQGVKAKYSSMRAYNGVAKIEALTPSALNNIVIMKK